MRPHIRIIALGMLVLLGSCDSPTETPLPDPPKASALDLTASRDAGLVDESVPLSVRLTDQYGQPFTPSEPVRFDAQGGEATPTGDTQATLLLTEAGTVTATATYGGLSDAVSVVAEARVPTALAITPDSFALAVGDTATLTLQVTDQAQDPIDLTEPLVWTSSDTVLATVSPDGTVRGRAVGVVTFTATSGSLGDSATATVYIANGLLEDTVSMTVGDRRPLPRLFLDGDTIDVERAEIYQPASDEAVDPDSVNQALLLKARHPGTSVVRIWVDWNDTIPEFHDSLVVTVAAPDQPYVQATDGLRSALGDGDTFTLRGHSLDLMASDAVTFGGSPLGLLSQSYSEAVIAAPPTADVGCAPAPRDILQIADATVLDSVSLLLVQKRVGEISLAVGDTLASEGAGLDCLMLEAGVGREYALAWFDVRHVEASRTGWAYPRDFVDYSVTVGEADATAGFQAAGSLASLEASADSTTWPWEACDTYSRTEPFHAGDKFTAYSTLDGGEKPRAEWEYDCHDATVVGVVGDLVFARLDSTPLLESVKDTTLAALGTLVDHEGMYQQAYDHPTQPATLGGQLLFLLQWGIDSEIGHTAGGTFTRTPRADGVQTPIVYLWLWGGGNLYHDMALSTLAHELTHAYQSAYAWDHDHFAPARWSMEGGAVLFAGEVLREAAGAPFTYAGDFQPEWFHFDDPNQGVNGGYKNSAAFMRWQIRRLLDGGVSYETALAAVLRGVGEGWYGYNVEGGKRRGLGERMAAHLSGYTPEDALVEWLLSDAALPGRRTRAQYDPEEGWRLADGFGWSSWETGPLTRDFRPLSGYTVRLLDGLAGGAWTVSATVPLRWGVIRTR